MHLVGVGVGALASATIELVAGLALACSHTANVVLVSLVHCKECSRSLLDLLRFRSDSFFQGVNDLRYNFFMIDENLLTEVQAEVFIRFAHAFLLALLVDFV